jgi:hypothetical protein
MPLIRSDSVGYRIIKNYEALREWFVSSGATAPSGPGAPHYWGFMITFRHTPLNRTPLDEWSARRKRSVSDNTQHSQETDIHAPAGIRTRNPSKRRPQYNALDGAATGIGGKSKCWNKYLSPCHFVYHKFGVVWPGIEPESPRWDADDWPAWVMERVELRSNVNAETQTAAEGVPAPVAGQLSYCNQNALLNADVLSACALQWVCTVLCDTLPCCVPVSQPRHHHTHPCDFLSEASGGTVPVYTITLYFGRLHIEFSDENHPDILRNTVEPGYNDIGLYDTSHIASDVLWYQLIPHC